MVGNEKLMIGLDYCCMIFLVYKNIHLQQTYITQRMFRIVLSNGSLHTSSYSKNKRVLIFYAHSHEVRSMLTDLVCPSFFYVPGRSFMYFTDLGRFLISFGFQVYCTAFFLPH